MKSSLFIRQFARGGFSLLLCAGLFSGCKRDDVKVYHVESGDSAAPTPPPIAPAAMPTAMPADLPAPDNSGLPQLKYVLPVGWQEKPPSEMRVASFGISEDGKNADVSVIPLGGMAGGDPANVNRWRGQVGLPPLADGEIEKLAEKISVGEQPADLYDITGGAQRILAVILHREDIAWFFKVTGDADLVEKQKSAFNSFLKSVEFDVPVATAATPMDMGQLPPSHPPIDGMDTGVQPANADAAAKPVWTVPPDWNETTPSEFLVAKFIIAGAGGAQAAVNISSLAGDGGGLLANVNRWRGQLGLPQISETDLPTLTTLIDSANGKIQVVDYTGTDSKTGKPARLIGAIVPQNGQTWFYKLMGDEQIVAQQKDAFTKFIQSANYANAR
jgi:hypothetical protein